MIGRTSILALVSLIALLFGCAKSSSLQVSKSVPSQPTSASPADAAIRIHWLGKKRIAADQDAARLTRLWDLPESVELEAQALDKLSDAPWRLLLGETNPPAAALLRPLLDDLVEEESCLEVRKSTNSPGGNDEIVLAVRLNDERAGLWRTNLAAALQSLTHIAPEASSTAERWALKKHHAPNLIEFVRQGEWVVIGAAQDRNTLLDGMLTRIERDRAPFHGMPTNFWLQADIDLLQTSAFAGRLPATFPRISLAMTEDRENVLTRAGIHFSAAVPFVSKTWNIPTNFIYGSLSSFTAMRGGTPEIVSRIWNEFETNPPPNQFYVWANEGIPMESYFAAPYADSSNAVSELTDFVITKAGVWFATNEMVRFAKAKSFHGLEWKGMPFISPVIESANTSGRSYILGGLFPLVGSNQPLSQQFFGRLGEQTNLIYYDWELSGSRLEQLTYITQLLHLLLGKSELAPDAASIKWLQAMSKKLGPCRTEIVRNSDREFSFARSASVPFTAIELHLLLEWLESSEFPAAGTFQPLFHSLGP